VLIILSRSVHYALCKYGISKVQNLVTVLGEILQSLNRKMRHYFQRINLCPTALVSGGSFYVFTNDNVGRTAIDLPRMVKSRKMTYREWPNPER
jgi:hypothetical protein